MVIEKRDLSIASLNQPTLKNLTNFLISFNSPLMQSPPWANFKHLEHQHPIYYLIKNSDTIIFSALVLKIKTTEASHFLYCPHGPITDYTSPHLEQLFSLFLNSLIEDHATTSSHLLLNPQIPTPPSFFPIFFQPSTYNPEPSSTRTVDLTESLENFLANSHPKFRYNLKIAEKNNIKITQNSETKFLNIFYTLYQQTASRNNFPPLPLSYFENLKSTFQDNTFQLYTAFHNETPLQSALILLTNSTATYFASGRTLLHKNLMPGYKLHYEIINSLKSQNLTTYDLRGISTPSNPTPDWQGFTRFKQQFHSNEHHSIPAQSYILNPSLYLNSNLP